MHSLTAFVKTALDRRRARQRPPFHPIAGWIRSVELPSLEDTQSLHCKHTPESPDEALAYLRRFAEAEEGYRSIEEFELNGELFCAMSFFEPHGSFLVVLGLGAERSVGLYHMGIAYFELDEKERSKKVNALCSELSIRLEKSLQRLIWG
ncbi:MAG TPA: hypothetical protein VG102_03630 [Candidatus Paceibacterota bacterium]|jgi:hypothetical protein|nr:hypothetical protein [Candidatus Paceibacterota bacterium]